MEIKDAGKILKTLWNVAKDGAFAAWAREGTLVATDARALIIMRGIRGLPDGQYDPELRPAPERKNPDYLRIYTSELRGAPLHEHAPIPTFKVMQNRALLTLRGKREGILFESMDDVIRRPDDTGQIDAAYALLVLGLRGFRPEFRQERPSFLMLWESEQEGWNRPGEPEWSFMCMPITRPKP